MGVYVFSHDVLLEMLDARFRDSRFRPRYSSRARLIAIELICTCFRKLLGGRSGTIDSPYTAKTLC